MKKSKYSLDKLGEFLIEDKFFRKDAAEILGQIKERKALKYLLVVLPEEKGEIKEAIEKAVAKIIDNQ